MGADLDLFSDSSVSKESVCNAGDLDLSHLVSISILSSFILNILFHSFHLLFIGIF